MATQITTELFKRSKFVLPYPKDVVPVPMQIPGTSFFPGGHGLYLEDLEGVEPSFPVGGVMILGQDFHNVDGYLKSLARGKEALNVATWLNLLNTLDAAGIEKSDCFFTNFFMGLRNSASPVGPFKGAEDVDFLERCRLFLLYQLAVQKPKLVLVLGAEVPSHISPLASMLEPWAKDRTFKELDEENEAVVLNAKFHSIDPFQCNLVSLVHPAQSRLNSKIRRWISNSGHSYEGQAAEVAMIRHAWLCRRS